MPVSVHAANAPTTLHKAPNSSIQGTPIVEPTVTALNKEKLENDTNWLWNYGATLITSLFSTLALFVGAIFALVRWFGDRQDERERRENEQKRLLEDRQAEREKRGEEHFQSVVEGLGSESKAVQVGAAITLRTFLRPGYEQFYSQTFDLAVAHLRLRHVVADTAEPLDSLSQALITIFRESFPLARQFVQNMQQLDATSVQLDHAYLAGADLERAWMPKTYLRQANLSGADLSGADLSEANLREANLSKADLIKANLREANLRGANLSGADLSEANLSKADLIKANLREANLSKADLFVADLSGADLSGANLSGADLSGANLSGADLSGADLSGADLSEADLQHALHFEKTKLLRIKGLTQKELETYKTKGAII